MKPLVSGPEAKRFQEPETDTYLLFPYRVDAAGVRLWTPDEMVARFPRAWAYLRSFEPDLRARESDAFDDDGWYRFGRNQNIDKQELAKLFVAQTVPSLRVFFDHRGLFYANNVRVNCILPEADSWFLTGVLNAPAADLIFKWIAKPKANNYFEANKQFIAPLPIPSSDDAAAARTAEIAQALQAGYTRRRRLLTGLRERLARLGQRVKRHEWLLPGVRSAAEIDAIPRPRMPVDERRALSNRLYKEEIEAALARIDDLIRLDSSFEAMFDDGELRFLVDGAQIASGVYVDDVMGELLLAQWEAVALQFEPKSKDDAKKLIDQLRKVSTEATPELTRQIIERQRELSDLSRTLVDLERELHELTCRMYGLSAEERLLVEAR